MAKHNYIILNGQVVDEPKIIKNQNNVSTRAILKLKVIRGVRDIGNNISHIKYDFPVIMSGNAEIIKIAEKVNSGDMVEVKGSITTKNVKKTISCPHCGFKNKQNGVVVFVNPIYLNVREKKVSIEKGIEFLKQRCEISNQATLIGPLCRDIQSFKLDSGLIITTYQMAVRRKFKILDDSAENRVDFPWIKSYGSIAVKDAESLKKGSYVFIDGMVQTREISKKTLCSQCNQEFNWKDANMEVVPYAVEYLRDYNTEEDIKKKEKEEQLKALRDVFDEDFIDNEKPNEVPKFEFKEADDSNEIENKDDLKKFILGE